MSSSLRTGALYALVSLISFGCSNGEVPSPITGSGGSSNASGGANGAAGAAGSSGGAANGSAGVSAIGGAPASAGAPSNPSVGTLMFSVPSGTFEAPFQVTIATTVPNAEIRYTTTGQAPNAASPLYVGTPLNVSATTSFTASAFVNGAPAGASASVHYVRRSGPITSNLPLIVLDDHGAGAPGEEAFVTASFMVFEPQQGQSSVALTPSVAARAGFRVRGQSSADFAQKSYRVELRDSTDADLDYAVLGMPAESDWVLHGPYVDKSLLRNAFAYGLGREIGLQAPRFAYAELYLNVDASPLEARDYNGVYLLVETIKNQRDRLNLQQLKPTDTALPAISGGYIFKFELDVAEPPLLSCVASRGAFCWQDLEVADPSPIIPAQQSYLNGHLQSFHDALYGASFADPNSGYAAFIDVDSFVNYMVFNELVRNLDGYIRSFYLYKDRDSKIFVGPMWDYNLMAGIGCCGNAVIEGFQYQVRRNGEANGWHQRLMEDPAFASRVKSRYHELRAGLLSDAALASRIDALAAPLRSAAERHFQRWPILGTANITAFTTSNANTYQGQLDHMKNWLRQRGTWLDTNW